MSMSRVIRCTNSIQTVARRQTVQTRGFASPPLHKATIHDGARGNELPGPKFPILEVFQSAPLLKTAAIAVAVVGAVLYVMPLTQTDFAGDMGYHKSDKQ